MRILCNEVKKILKSLKKDKSPGPDGIPPLLLKEWAEEISYPLSNIFQTSLDSGRLPKDWLTANASPIYKGGQHVDPKNCQPVSLTSMCLKVMEHIIKVALTRCVDSKQIMSTRQHGFSNGLINSYEQWTRALDRKSRVDVIYLDIRKVFDCVPHFRLLQKLDQLGIAGRLHS